MTDSNSLRNGGLVWEDSQWFRVGQLSEFDEYGTAMSILEPTRVGTNLYKEEKVAEVRANFKAGINGTHHMSGTKGISVIDVYKK